MQPVRAKKHLGQHFLNDLTIAEAIVNSLVQTDKYDTVLEIGPGMGVLTQFLIQQKNYTTFPIDVDRESIVFLVEKFPTLKGNIIYGDFLKINLNEIVNNKSFAVIGNFPYNISTQILFKVYEYRHQVPELVGMFQKEVAERVASKPGNKTYGITSVLLQAYFDIDYLFTVDEHVFDPPPKVKSAVIRLTRNKTEKLDCDEVFFKVVVKTAFNQRRKTMRNSVKVFLNEETKQHPILDKRPEQLSVEEFVMLTNLLKG